MGGKFKLVGAGIDAVAVVGRIVKLTVVAIEREYESKAPKTR